MKSLILDTETTGLPNFHLPIDHPTQPEIVSIATLYCEDFKIINRLNCVVKHDSLSHIKALEVHGISQDFAAEHGLSFFDISFIIRQMLESVDVVFIYNTKFDKFILETAFAREKQTMPVVKHHTCVMAMMRSVMGTDKYPKLKEALEFCFGENNLNKFHTSNDDVNHTLLILGWILANKPDHLTASMPSVPC